jgi:hypothetical protein
MVERGRVMAKGVLYESVSLIVCIHLESLGMRVARGWKSMKRENNAD